jgi:hypothetical protein
MIVALHAAPTPPGTRLDKLQDAFVDDPPRDRAHELIMRDAIEESHHILPISATFSDQRR